ncbi:MAG: sugar transferase [Oscillospiraceae bacterium]|nr:sugar transferase [Oscillospiraceae bacterium]
MLEHRDAAAESLQLEINTTVQKSKKDCASIREERIGDLEYIDVTGNKYLKLKRIVDIVVSFVALCILLLPILIIALVVYIDDPGKVIFTQNRVGRYGTLFKLYKFRTMKYSAPKYMATNDMHDADQYITGAGKILRKLSLDEIPQLINVLKGDMSLVGPRPLIAEEREIHEMRGRFGVYNICPGVTGLAQINGRDLVDAEHKLRWDIEYLKNISFWTDLKILFITVPKILTHDGVEEGGTCESQETIE